MWTPSVAPFVSQVQKPLSISLLSALLPESHGLCHHGQSDSILSTIFSIVDWIKAIINPSLSLGISKAEEHKFIIHAVVFCDVTWMSRNEVGSCTGW